MYVLPKTSLIVHTVALSILPFDIKFGDRLYSKEKRRAKIDAKVKVTTWIWHVYIEKKTR